MATYRKPLKILAVIIGVFLLSIASLVTWVYVNQHKIFVKAKNAVDSSLNGKLEIGGFEFNPFGRNPGLTFSLRDIHLSDSLYHRHGKPFALIKRLDITFGFETLFLMGVSIKNIDVQEGSIFIFKRRDSYSNLSIFSSGDKKNDTEQKSGSSNPFQKVKMLKLNDVRMVYADSLKEKYFGADMKRVSGQYSAGSNGWEAGMSGPVYVEKLVFNAAKGAFLRKQNIQLNIALKFDQQQKHLEILPETSVQLEALERINISGLVSTAGQSGPLRLRFQTNRIRVPVAASVLADSIAAKIDRVGIDTYVSADVRVRGDVGQKNPWVKVEFKTDTFSYETPVGFFRGMKTNGYFTNGIDSLLSPGNANSEIKTGRVTGFFEKVPVKGSLRITDLNNPKAGIIFHAKIDSSGLNSLLDSDRYLASKGLIMLDLRFVGKLKDLYNPATDQLDGALSGKATVRDLAVTYLPKKVKLSRIESNISFNQSVFVIHKLNLFDNQNQLFITGKLSRVLHHLLGSKTPAKAEIDIDIPKWKLNWIEVLVGQSGVKEEKSSRKFSKLIDELVNDLEIDANLKAGELNYNTFSARNIVGKMVMNGNVTNVSQLSLDAFGGHVNLSGKLVSPNDESSRAVLDAKGKISNADVSNILFSFNDFGQKALSSKNVKGMLDLDFRFSSQVNPDVSLIPNSMNGHLDMHLTKGELVNFEPFLKIKKIIFKNRPLENVKIAPIRERFNLKGQEVRIRKTQIESNVLTLFVEGQYSFGDKTDLSIQFPLRNLKKRDEDYEFQTYDSAGLSSIFLRAVEEEGEVNIKLDTRKKARKRSYPESTDKSKDSTSGKQ